jgi:hypothetical protein
MSKDNELPEVEAVAADEDPMELIGELVDDPQVAEEDK